MFRAPRDPLDGPKTRPVEILTSEEVKSLLRACSGRAPTGIRNRALMVCGWRAGMRIGECLSALPRSLSREAGTVNIMRGKGGKQRTVGLDPTAFALVERWLDKRAELGLNGRHPLFCTLKGEVLKSSYVRALMPRLARKAGIEKRVHFHALRHAHAHDLAREHTPINVIQAQLGHSSLATTHVYLSKIAPQQVIDTIQARKWSL